MADDGFDDVLAIQKFRQDNKKKDSWRLSKSSRPSSAGCSSAAVSALSPSTFLHKSADSAVSMIKPRQDPLNSQFDEVSSLLEEAMRLSNNTVYKKHNSLSRMEFDPSSANERSRSKSSLEVLNRPRSLSSSGSFPPANHVPLTLTKPSSSEYGTPASSFSSSSDSKFQISARDSLGSNSQDYRGGASGHSSRSPIQFAPDQLGKLDPKTFQLFLEGRKEIVFDFEDKNWLELERKCLEYEKQVGAKSRDKIVGNMEIKSKVDKLAEITKLEEEKKKLVLVRRMQRESELQMEQETLQVAIDEKLKHAEVLRNSTAYYAMMLKRAQFWSTVIMVAQGARRLSGPLELGRHMRENISKLRVLTRCMLKFVRERRRKRRLRAMLVLNKYACLFARKARQLRLNRATNLAKWFLGYCKQRRVYMVLRFFFKRVVRSQSVVRKFLKRRASMLQINVMQWDDLETRMINPQLFSDPRYPNKKAVLIEQKKDSSQQQSDSGLSSSSSGSSSHLGRSNALPPLVNSPKTSPPSSISNSPSNSIIFRPISDHSIGSSSRPKSAGPSISVTASDSPSGKAAVRLPPLQSNKSSPIPQSRGASAFSIPSSLSATKPRSGAGAKNSRSVSVSPVHNKLSSSSSSDSRSKSVSPSSASTPSQQQQQQQSDEVELSSLPRIFLRFTPYELQRMTWPTSYVTGFQQEDFVNHFEVPALSLNLSNGMISCNLKVNKVPAHIKLQVLRRQLKEHFLEFKKQLKQWNAQRARARAVSLFSASPANFDFLKNRGMPSLDARVSMSEMSPVVPAFEEPAMPSMPVLIPRAKMMALIKIGQRKSEDLTAAAQAALTAEERDNAMHRSHKLQAVADHVQKEDERVMAMFQRRNLFGTETKSKFQ